MDYPQPPEGSTDVFSVSDQVLSEKLQFIEEIGFGNWGSVWLCQPKPSSPNGDNADEEGIVRVREAKIAVKLVHRSKTSTTAARVRSLWNEMKIVRSFKADPHPSIVPFHSFIITPSYALITMAYLPKLIPVEVEETKAREWFRFLLSGVEFLHKRGVVHNDIKPANILLSSKNIPVLVDFGFAEKYDVKSKTAFHSNLSYGTPEYLSPERARGLPHDTRKSDVWSLGITFFEIIVGRTPFEHSDSEQFSTKEDLEKYWARTLRGKWIGSWKMSKGMERLLRKMISPNADLRCTTSDAMDDSLWRSSKESESLHRRAASYNSSLTFESNRSSSSRLHGGGASDKENSFSPPGLASPVASTSSKENSLQRSLTKSKSQPKVSSLNKIQVTTRKRVPVPPVVDLSPIKGSPTASPAKQHVMATLNNNSRRTRDNLPLAPKDTNRVKANAQPPVKPLSELTGNRAPVKRDSVRDRVREWEREKERLREMERLDELERERDAQIEAERAKKQQEEDEKENTQQQQPQQILSTPAPKAQVSTAPVTSPRNHSFNIPSFKHSVKLSFDKTLQFYKNTTTAGRSSKTLDGGESQHSSMRRESWEDEEFERDVKSSLPVVRHALHNERVAEDNRMDRMAIWMRNVERVVEDTRQNFASSSTEVTPLPPLPLPVSPMSRAIPRVQTSRSSRLPRKILAASQIFSDADSSMNMSSMDVAANTSTGAGFSEGTSQIMAQLRTPVRPRRATVSTGSPGDGADQLETGSPSKRKEKSRSHADLIDRRISPLEQLEKEIAKPIVSAPSPRLADVLDRSLIIASPVSKRSDDRSRSFDELNSSPYHVEPYKVQSPAEVPDSPSVRRMEGVYDRFLMATTGVKRVGKGYQSDNAGPVSYTVGGAGKENQRPVSQRQYRTFNSARRAMQPPVSSEDYKRQSASVDELGMMTYPAAPCTPKEHGTNTNTITLVRRAFKAFVPGSKRISRVGN